MSLIAHIRHHRLSWDDLKSPYFAVMLWCYKDFSVKIDRGVYSQICCEFISPNLGWNVYIQFVSELYMHDTFICFKNHGPNIMYLTGLVMPICTILLVWLEQHVCLRRLKGRDCVLLQLWSNVVHFTHLLLHFRTSTCINSRKAVSSHFIYSGWWRLPMR